MFRFNLFLSVLVTVSVSGCVDDIPTSDGRPIPPTATADPLPAPAEPVADRPADAPPVTFLDSESLQRGTGPIDDGHPTEFQTTDSGLKYRVLRGSDGQMPTADDTVTVHYRGWLDDGTEFDSSYGRGQTTSFPLNGVIAGWTEGLQLVGEAGMIELWIPSELGYGTRGSGGSVPPNATLHFIVELKSIK